MATFAHRAAVNPQMLTWALARASAQPREVARSVGVSAESMDAWLEGIALPTFPQARSFARRTHVPFGLLFASKPPDLILPVADFRRFQSEGQVQPTPELLEVLFAIVRKQDWWRERLETQGVDSNPIVGSVPKDADAKLLASRFRELLGVDPDWFGPPGAGDRFVDLARRIEGLGVLVMQRGIVGNNTKRVLDPEDFRGFALADPVAPVLFVNSADSKASQVFTLVHEFMHILLGETGVSTPFTGSKTVDAPEVERKADRAAGEFLVPRDQLLGIWPADLGANAAVTRAARHFRVSELAIAVAALEANLIERSDFEEISNRSIQAWRNRQRSPGGNFYTTAISRNGRRFTSEVLRAVSSRQVLATEGASLLEVGVGNLGLLERTLEGAT